MFFKGEVQDCYLCAVLSTACMARSWNRIMLDIIPTARNWVLAKVI